LASVEKGAHGARAKAPKLGVQTGFWQQAPELWLIPVRVDKRDSSVCRALCKAGLVR